MFSKWFVYWKERFTVMWKDLGKIIGESLWVLLQVVGHGGKELMNCRSGVVHLNWGNFQRKEGGEFMRNYWQISLATGSY